MFRVSTTHEMPIELKALPNSEGQIFNTISWGGQKGEIEKRKEGRRIYLFIGPAAGLLDPHLPYIYLDICLYTKHA